MRALDQVCAHRVALHTKHCQPLRTPTVQASCLVIYLPGPEALNLHQPSKKSSRSTPGYPGHRHSFDLSTKISDLNLYSNVTSTSVGSSPSYKNSTIVAVVDSHCRYATGDPTAIMFSRPSNRPAYMDTLFRENQAPSTPSIHSSTSSISCSSTASNFDLRGAYQSSARPLTPAMEESIDDRFSLRSKKSFVSPRRFRFGRIFHRQTYPTTEANVAAMVAADEAAYRPPPPSTSAGPAFSSAAMTDGFPTPRRPSLPRLQTSFPPPRGASTYAKKPLPAVPRPVAQAPTAQELSCQRCYYYTARNCHGWVLGGLHGDACDTCLVCTLIHPRCSA